MPAAGRGRAPASAPPRVRYCHRDFDRPQPKMSGRQSWSQRQGRGPITHPGYECPVGRQYGKHSIWEPDARESSAAAAECPALACATCSGLRLTVASAAAGCFRMAVLSRPDIVSWSVTKLGHWDIRSPEQIFGRCSPPLLLLLLLFFLLSVPLCWKVRAACQRGPSRRGLESRLVLVALCAERTSCLCRRGRSLANEPPPHQAHLEPTRPCHGT